MHDWLDLLSSERWALLEATAAHLELVIEAVLLAVLTGVPLGILAARRPALERVSVGITGVLQTIPSLALLGFLLIAFRGQIGKPPALAALSLYALLPIVKNTILGLRSIDPGIREAATRAGDDRHAAAPPGRASPGDADRAGRDPRGHRGLRGHGDDRGGHRRARSWQLHLPRSVTLRHATDPPGLGPLGLAGAGL